MTEVEYEAGKGGDCGGGNLDRYRGRNSDSRVFAMVVEEVGSVVGSLSALEVDL